MVSHEFLLNNINLSDLAGRPVTGRTPGLTFGNPAVKPNFQTPQFTPSTVGIKLGKLKNTVSMAYTHRCPYTHTTDFY